MLGFLLECVGIFVASMLAIFGVIVPLIGLVTGEAGFSAGGLLLGLPGLAIVLLIFSVVRLWQRVWALEARLEALTGVVAKEVEDGEQDPNA